MIKKADMSNHCDGKRYRSFMFADVHQADAASGRLCRWLFKSTSVRLARDSGQQS